MDKGDSSEKKKENAAGIDDKGEGVQVRARDVWHSKLRGEKRAPGEGSTGYGGNTAPAGNNHADGTVYYGAAPSGGTSLKKAILIFCCIIAGLVLIGIVTVFTRTTAPGDPGSYSGAADVHGDHIGVLYVEGTISEDDGTYDHGYALDAVKGMTENEDNMGLMLFVNTPGGGVYESDELYLAIREYKETTGRPVYAYFASQATSGGYYISACADRIIANRNCWTGSIGVTVGTIYDISGLLERYGIKTETITSGANKAMGDITAPMTAEQRAIFQSLVDEAYEQFVAIVAEGRGLGEDRVRELADGRIYTAQQAEELGLVDDVTGTYDDALDAMMYDCNLEYCDIREFRYFPEEGLFTGLIESVDRLSEAVTGQGDLAVIEDMMDEAGGFDLRYMCEELR